MARSSPLTLALTSKYGNNPAASLPCLLGGAVNLPLDFGERRSRRLERAVLGMLYARYALSSISTETPRARDMPAISRSVISGALPSNIISNRSSAIVLSLPNSGRDKLLLQAMALAFSAKIRCTLGLSDPLLRLTCYHPVVKGIAFLDASPIVSSLFPHYCPIRF